MVTHTIGLAGCRNRFKYGGGMQDKNIKLVEAGFAYFGWQDERFKIDGGMRDLKLRKLIH